MEMIKGIGATAVVLLVGFFYYRHHIAHFIDAKKQFIKDGWIRIPWGEVTWIRRQRNKTEWITANFQGELVKEIQRIHDEDGNEFIIVKFLWTPFLGRKRGHFAIPKDAWDLARELSLLFVKERLIGDDILLSINNYGLSEDGSITVELILSIEWHKYTDRLFVPIEEAKQCLDLTSGLPDFLITRITSFRRRARLEE